ncbi:hypothetical protein C0992_006218 [Termitomyces sp. T32_za158]|nr:hypothetical protein C0992_006218 [Termitomyces sp. T32_za158]
MQANCLQCLRLTNRCADILLSVREEIKEDGDQIDEELQAPIAKLTEASQDAQDLAQDSEDLRTLIRVALRTESDVEIFRLLQIAREEMPEVIKTLQRALERGVHRIRDQRAAAYVVGRRDPDVLAALMDDHAVRSRPRAEDRHGGLLGRLPRTWRGRTVATKVLAQTTPRELFVREVQVWRGLRHPAVLELYGASSACGERPWFFVCENTRPAVPLSRFNTALLQDLLRVCWYHDPAVRPSFSAIVRDVRALRRAFLNDTTKSLGRESPLPLSSPIAIDRSRHSQEWDSDQLRTKPSPDMRPLPLPHGTPPAPDSAFMGHMTLPDSSYGTFVTADESSLLASPNKAHQSHREDIIPSGPVRMPEPVIYTPSSPSDSSASLASSLSTHTPSTSSLEDLGLTTPGHPVSDGEGYDSPAPQDERFKLTRDERRYRLLLSLQFHPSLTLPLWEPSPVKLGAVGYLLKPEGKFITLFNSFSPEKSGESAVRGLPSLYGYGKVSSGSQRQDKRNAAQSGKVSPVVIRSHFALDTRWRTHMFTESTMYRYMERLEVPKRWFKANVDAIMQIYGPMHHIQKEDLFLVIGTLEAQEYVLFVSHSHPDGQAHFNVFTPPRNGQPWGTFTTDTEVPPEMGNSSYDEPMPGRAISSSKVSKVGLNWENVLARLRFKQDASEPTSL